MHLNFIENEPIGLGTWLLRDELCTKVVEDALGCGYKHIDTAHSYDNFEAIGKALEGKARDSFLIASKITLNLINFNHPKDSLESLCDYACKKMGLEYLDLLLIHWPDREKPIAKAYEGIMNLVEKGKIRSHGVSNFTEHHLEDLIMEGFVPEVNQVELHPYLSQKKLQKFCNLHGIEIVSYRCFGKGELLHDETILPIAIKHNRSISDVLIRYCLQNRIAVIPKASSKEHLEQNIAAQNFMLDPSDMEILESLNNGKRFCKPDHPEHFY